MMTSDLMRIKVGAPSGEKALTFESAYQVLGSVLRVMAQTADEPINWKLIATASFSHQDLGVEKLILCFLMQQQISDGDEVSLCNFVDVHTIDAYLLSLG